jgi:hypothetical protein
MLLASASACTGPGSRFKGVAPVDDYTSAVYVYRPEHAAGGAYLPSVIIDGRPQAGLGNGGFLRRELLPGLHIIELRPPSGMDSPKPVKLPFEAKRGRIHFIRYHIGPASDATAADASVIPGVAAVSDSGVAYTVELVEEAVAVRELAGTRAVESRHRRR